MAASTVEKTPFELAREMRSVCVTDITRNNEIITLLVMDEQNCNEVLAFILCDVSTGKVHCSDRENRPIFTAESGIGTANKKKMTVSIKSGETGLFPCGVIKNLGSDMYQIDNNSIGKKDPNCKLMIKYLSSDGDGLYTVTNALLDEVCIMRSERRAMHIIYFQSMSGNGKLLLLAFSVKRLFVTFRLADLNIPHVEISAMSPGNVFHVTRHKEIIGSMIDDTKHPSTNISSLKEAAFRCAGYNKTLGMQYYDIHDMETGIIQVTFEVWRDKLTNITAISKDRYGSTVMAAGNQREDWTITMASKKTFTFKSFNKKYPQVYDEDGNLFLGVRKTRKMVNRQMISLHYNFFHPDSCEGKVPSQAIMRCTRSGLPTIFFNNPDLDDTRKALILVLAMRASILYFHSHTLVMPPIDYCYIRKS